MRFRAGLFPAVNAAIGAVGVVVFGLLLAVCVSALTTGQRLVPILIATAAALGLVVACVAWTLSSLNSLRPVRLVRRDDGSCWLSVPVLTVRHGFGRDLIAADDVTGVRLEYLAQPRNGRWQLAIDTRDGVTRASDCISCTRSQKQGATGTRAEAVTVRLRRQLRQLQSS